MSRKVVYVGQDDEISDVISKVRDLDEGVEVALVLPANAHVFQTPLNVRLLSQFAAREGRSASIVSGDVRIQQMAHSSGFPTYASVVAYERGIQLVEPHAVVDSPMLRGGGLAVASAPPVATATRVAPPRQLAPPGSLPPAGQGRIPPVVPVQPRPGGRDRRRALYFALIALGVVGLLLFLLLSPSAKITVTITGQQISVNPTIQGTPDANEARQADHMLTKVVTATGTGQFQAAPTGQKQVAAAPGTGNIRMRITDPGNVLCSLGCTLPLAKGTQFQTSDSSALTFVTTADAMVKVSTGQNWSDPVAVQAATAGAKTNVAAGLINKWPQCSADPGCSAQKIAVSNLEPTAGGADAKTLTVASDADLAGWNNQINQLKQTLTQKAKTDLSAAAPGKTLAADPNGGGQTITFAVSPNIPNSGDQFAATAFTVTMNGKATAYDPAAVRAVVTADLNQRVPQGDTLVPNQLNVTAPQIIQASDDGHLALSVTASDYHLTDVHLDDLKDSLVGKGPNEVQAIIQHRIDHVQSVAIDEKPLSLFFMPFFSSRISIVENFVTAQPAQASPGT